ncbi:hypothetical protein F4861DRAFT_173420 [Xylaria intraflava]|nr:hypothetical protein F4861DRAFT_173420 [Xylaria intraflava]
MGSLGKGFYMDFLSVSFVLSFLGFFFSSGFDWDLGWSGACWDGFPLATVATELVMLYTIGHLVLCPGMLHVREPAWAAVGEGAYSCWRSGLFATWTRRISIRDARGIGELTWQHTGLLRRRIGLDLEYIHPLGP